MAYPFPYQVWVDDNANWQDEVFRYKLGEYATCEEATAICKSLLDNFLQNAYKPGMTAVELIRHYANFGEEPGISSHGSYCSFSGWNYAKERCETYQIYQHSSRRELLDCESSNS